MTEEAPSLAIAAPTTEPATTPETAPAETPASPQPAGELLAGKFKSVDDLTKAYKELERSYHQKAAPVESVSSVIERAGIRADEIATNFQQQGRLTDDQYAALAKVGYSRAVVDEYMTGQMAIAATRVNAAQQARDRAFTAAGGPEQWNSLTEWARTHYTPEQIKSFDARLADPSTSDSAVKEMLYDYRVVAGNSVGVSMVAGQAAPNVSAGFSTVDEVREAMRTIERQGNKIDPALKRRLERTPQHLFNGITR